jgi:hypothetical protein
MTSEAESAHWAQPAAYWTWGYAQPAWAEAVPYGSEETYEIGMGWLVPACRSVEDWGAGPAWARRWVPEDVTYLAVDFAATAIRPGWSQVQADLASYVSAGPDGIFMRHVLEHNDAWAVILANAVASFTRRMCLVTFIPLAGETRCLAPQLPGRDWQFAREDLVALMAGTLREDFNVPSKTAFGSEHVFLLAREGFQ